MTRRLDYDNARRSAQARREPHAGELTWWLTVAAKAAQCHECGEPIPVSTAYAFRSADKMSVCTICIDRLGLLPQESRRYKAFKNKPAKLVELAPGGRVPTLAEMRQRQTKRGGFTRETLAEWGVPWPPPKGWRRELERRAKAKR